MNQPLKEGSIIDALTYWLDECPGDVRPSSLLNDLAAARRALSEADSRRTENADYAHKLERELAEERASRDADAIVAESARDALAASHAYAETMTARLKWTRDRWQDIVEDAATLSDELKWMPALLLGIQTVAQNERDSCDAALAKNPANVPAEPVTISEANPSEKGASFQTPEPLSVNLDRYTPSLDTDGAPYMEPDSLGCWVRLPDALRAIKRSSPSQGLDSIPEGETPADARMLRAANHTLAGEVHEAVEIVRDLVRQINEFAEQHGEADFFTGKAAALLQGYDTVSEEHICGAADDAGEGPCPLCQSQTVQGLEPNRPRPECPMGPQPCGNPVCAAR